MIAAVPFRFDHAAHRYIDLATGRTLPHITGMLEAAGLVDDLWFTEESAARGTLVHRLTADYDLGALDVDQVDGLGRPYLLAHVDAMKVLQPEILRVEEPFVHPIHRYGGRPDRVIRYQGVAGVLELKTAAPADSHPVQTALQAILVAPALFLPAESLVRLCLYLQPSGKWKVVQHPRHADFVRARRIIRECCG
jgi:hypothetical protein